MFSKFSKLCSNNLCINILLLIAGCLTLASCAALHRDEAVIDKTALKGNEGIVFLTVEPRAFKPNGDGYSKEDTPNVGYSLSYSALPAPGKSSSFFSGFSSFGSVDGSTRSGESLFARCLPAGEYSISRLSVTRGGRTATTDIDVRFTVVPNKATYIGTVQLDFYGDETGGRGNKASETVTLKVADGYDRAKNLFTERNPGVGFEITADLMKR